MTCNDDDTTLVLWCCCVCGLGLLLNTARQQQGPPCCSILDADGFRETWIQICRIWVKSRPGNNAKFEISQIWVKYDTENSKTKQITICRQCVCFGNMLGLVLKQIYPTMVGEYWQIQKTLFSCSNFSENGLIMHWVLGHLLSPWLPV